MTYLNISIGARRRLDYLREYAESLNARHNARKAAGDMRPYTWRDVRYCGFHNARAYRCELSPGRQGDRPIWYAHTGPQFPREQYAHEIIDIRHTGWYTDIECRETARGIVVALPRGRFLAGYEWSENGERVYFADIYDSAEEAARAADSEAEYFAEEAREHDARFQEARLLEDEIDEKLSRLRECLALRNRPCFAHLREEARELMDKIRTARAILAEEYADYI